MERALLSAMEAPTMAGYMLGATSLAGHALGGPALGGFALGAATLGGIALGGAALGGFALGGAALGGATLGGATLPLTMGSSPRDIVSKYMKIFTADPESDPETNLFDVLPVISQAKSCFQLIFGDSQDALNTQKKFVAKCPIAAQIKSFYELVDGDIGKAWRTQKEFFAFWFDTAASFAGGIPGIGHIIGALAYIFGNKQYAAQCMESASRTAGVILGAAVGTFFGGPVGAAVGAVGGGLLMDLVITGVKSVINDQFTPSGYVAAIDKIFKGEAKAGDIFDILCGVGIEAGMAYLYAKQSARVRTTVFDEQQMDPEKLRFSQTSVKGESVENMKSTITKNQNQGRMDFTMPAVDAIKMPDGQLTVLDNRRLLVARETKAPIFVRVIEGDTLLPADQHGRFEINGRNPEIMSEAVRNRVAEQRPASLARANPNGFQDCPKKIPSSSQVPTNSFQQPFFRQNAGPISEVMTALGNIFTPRNRPRD